MPPDDDVLGRGGPGDRRGTSAGRWLAWGVVVVLLAGIALHVARTRDELAYVQRLSPGVLLLTLLLQCAAQLCLNASMLLPLQLRVEKLRFWELYLVRAGGSLVGSLVPVGGGLAVRLAYLRSLGLTYLDFTWATLVSNLLALAAAAAVAGAASVLMWAVLGPPPASVLGVLGGVVAVSVAALAAFELLPQLTRHPRLRRWRWLATMDGLLAHRVMSVRVFGLSIARHGLNFLTFGALCHALSGVPADVLTGGLVYALTSPIRMVNITPGNLGVTEWVVALVGKALAFDLATGLVVGLAFRGLGMLAQALGAVLASAWLHRARAA